MAYLATVGILIVTGPFETYAMPLGLRTVYWAASIGVGWVVITAFIFAARRVTFAAGWPAFSRVLTAMCMAVPIIAVTSYWIDFALRPNRMGVSVWIFLLNVAVLSALIGGIALARIRPRLISPAALPARNAFLDRLPPKLGTALISLTSQDHYVEVTTAKGHDLIHMRLSDAIDALGAYPGQQIHRSHWISAHAFTGTTRDGDRLMAHLVDGRALPVSRSFAPTVRRMAPVRPLPPNTAVGPVAKLP